MSEIDSVNLNFSPEGLQFMNICLGLIMFGVALELHIEDFRRVLRKPKGAIIGVVSQFIWLPAITFLFVLWLNPHPSFALGLILIAACPGGNVSNFFSLMAKGNVALSVSLTAIATVLCIILTPLNFTLYGNLFTPAAHLLQDISLNPKDMIWTIFTLLGVPLVIGMTVAANFPKFKNIIIRPIRILSIVLFLGFIVGAFYNNLDYFMKYVHLVFLLVAGHNILALLLGYGWSKLFGLSEPSCRSISIETGIQNGGLGLILIFNFFDGLGGMAIVAAWWGIWDMIIGLGLAYFWSKKKYNFRE